MIGVAIVLLVLAIKFKFEPLLLVPIAFGILLANLPGATMMLDTTGGQLGSFGQVAIEGAHWYDSGVLRILYVGVKSGIFPCLIFIIPGFLMFLKGFKARDFFAQPIPVIVPLPAGL
jgi:oxaloacetate decarboxylase beta subunit